MRYYCTVIRMFFSKQQKISTGENREKLEPSHTVDKNINSPDSSLRGITQHDLAILPKITESIVFVQLVSCVRFFVTPQTAACQASLSCTISWGLLKLMSIESVMPSSHLILCRPFLLLPPIPPNIKVFSNESTLRMRWPKYWSF